MLTVERIKVLRSRVETLRQELLKLASENFELKEELKLNSELVQQLEFELEEYKQNEKGLINEVEQLIEVLENKEVEADSPHDEIGENSEQEVAEYSPGY